MVCVHSVLGGHKFLMHINESKPPGEAIQPEPCDVFKVQLFYAPSSQARPEIER